MRWTKDQASAIEARGTNLLVAAAAGSGKTSVLVERVSRLVEEGANVDEMLIVTFTRAASADMREKLRRRFSERAAQGDARAREQAERLESASISTLHSFCTSVLRQNFEAAGVDPQFRVLDDAEDRQWTDRAMDEALEDAYKAGGADMDALDYARGPAKVRALALEMYRFLRERPDAEGWMDEAFERMEGDGEAWLSVLERAAHARIREALACNRCGRERASLPEGPANYMEAMEKDEEAIEAMLSLSYRDLRWALDGFKQARPKTAGRRGEAPSPDETALRDEVTTVRKRVKTQLDAARKAVALDPDQSLADIRAGIPAMRRLYALALDLDRRLREKKLARAALTFSDLERYTLAALSDDRVAESVRAKYAYVFVDEYQDTSDVQEAILNRIVRSDNRFMVGDVKQSIYRFRAAEPSLFLEKYARYRADDGGRLIVLRQNFRSRGCVIDFVNHVFARVMTGGDSEILYDDDAKLYQGASFEGEDDATELLIVNKGARDEDAADAEDDEDELNDAEREGLVIARRIHELKAENPRLRYRDICVLTRVRVGALNHLASVLAADGIPAYADASESYFDALEVMEVMSALKLIANRRRDVDLISVLRSPIVGLTTTNLAEIRAACPAGSFCDAVLSARESQPLADEFLRRLDDWRVLSRAMSLPALIRRILSDTGFYAYVGALPGGSQRQANLDVLCARAAAYEQSVGGSLAEFIEYAQDMRARGDGDAAHVLGENDDVVRLMTAHKSKGLEFPVVFCSLLGRRLHSTRASDNLLSHRDLGPALKYMDEARATCRDTVARQAITAQETFESRAEELRILYVMLTRAKSRLILTGTVASLSAKCTQWRIAARESSIYKSFLDIVAAAAYGCPGAQALGGGESGKGPRVNVRVFAPGMGAGNGESGENAVSPLDALEEALDAKYANPRVLDALLWRYPHANDAHAPVKLTASGLAREVVGAEAMPDVVERPAFLQERSLTATERGTAVHAALRALDYAPFRALPAGEYLNEARRQLDGMRTSGRLSGAEADAVRPAVLAAFLASPLGQRLLAAEVVEREWRFNLRMPAREAVPDAPETSEIIVQGSVDLCFLENGKWVLVDYKTDRADDEQALLERYRPQLALYAKALERITGREVAESDVCLVTAGKTLRV